MQITIKETLRTYFPMLVDAELINRIAEHGLLKEVAEGEILMDIGGVVSTVPMIVSGLIKIIREDAQGNELLLYTRIK